MADYALYTDQALTDLLQQEDQLAFREIYNRYWNLLFTLAARQLDNAQEAEDTVQQLFIEIWERRKNIQVKRSLNHWLAAAVKFKVLSIYSARHRQLSITGILPEDLPAQTPQPHSILEMQQLMAQLEAAVEALPERPRIVYRMSREGNLSNQEIARQLDISEKTVENHMNRALTSIRKSLGDAALSISILLF
ncbi:MAG: RNA polymerase sigma-70 factor [Candidatus Pseudobacter hemicellulosilyticus]|uniref:RNA polymerase sigma-70 factor n=1 Tax=Candidatus Pseudobacter hemicellulosilyticus TaxID=3121375 RepID=A0AAJ5WM97_9BACT|nr:MAG: RNA polymerase sigma-70 factor [Pseudobacter sp.]